MQKLGTIVNSKLPLWSYFTTSEGFPDITDIRIDRAGKITVDIDLRSRFLMYSSRANQVSKNGSFGTNGLN